MRYSIHGPFELPTNGTHYIHLNKAKVHKFWKSVDEQEEGLSTACGCYVFGIRAGRGIIPWYVGKADKLKFVQECLSSDKLVKFNNSLQLKKKGTPVLFLYARRMSKDKFCKNYTNGARDIEYLEKMLIGYAPDRNDRLVNIKETALLKQMSIPGLINSGSGRLKGAPRLAARMMGY